MRAKSSRHHYIPQYVINGFKNHDEQLFVYDKLKDIILPRSRSSKSIFWERHRNTIQFNELENSSIIEDEIFNRMDNSLSQLIMKLQLNKNDDNLLSIENLGQFQFFIINLFWRIPLTDYAFEDLIERLVLPPTAPSEKPILKDEAFRKFQRAGIFRHTISEIQKTEPPRRNFCVNFSEFKEDLFILGDYPILFVSTPRKFVELNYLDYMFPVSSKRIFIHTMDEYENFTKKLAFDFNALIIDQSKKYIVSGNRQLLENSIAYYRKLKDHGLLFGLKEKLFSGK